MSKPRNPRASIFDHLALRAHVIEASGPSTPAIKRLVDNARAPLMPSFAEGYGYPVARRWWQETCSPPTYFAEIEAFLSQL